jgi:DNA-directed RNA polymerase subunit K/omega
MPPKKNTKLKSKYEDDDIDDNEDDVNEEEGAEEEENDDDDKDDDDEDKDKNEEDGEEDDADYMKEELDDEDELDEKEDNDDDEADKDDDGDDEYLENIEGGANANEEEEDSDDESDDKYKKITKYINKDELLKYHTECIVQNYDEIRSMSDIQLKSAHVTIPLLTKYERARIIGMRTVQLNNGATPLVEVPDTLIDNAIIAEKELMAKKIPFILCRPLPNGSKEYWKLEDLEIL